MRTDMRECASACSPSQYREQMSRITVNIAKIFSTKFYCFGILVLHVKGFSEATYHGLRLSSSRCRTWNSSRRVNGALRKSHKNDVTHHGWSKAKIKFSSWVHCSEINNNGKTNCNRLWPMTQWISHETLFLRAELTLIALLIRALRTVPKRWEWKSSVCRSGECTCDTMVLRCVLSASNRILMNC